LGAGGYGQATGNSTANISDNSLGQDLSSDGSFRIDGQRLYNLALHNDFAVHYILIDIKGKDFNSIPLLSARWRDDITKSRPY
jgi:hypothetical protein